MRTTWRDTFPSLTSELSQLIFKFYPLSSSLGSGLWTSVFSQKGEVMTLRTRKHNVKQRRSPSTESTIHGQNMFPKTCSQSCTSLPSQICAQWLEGMTAQSNTMIAYMEGNIDMYCTLQYRHVLYIAIETWIDMYFHHPDLPLGHQYVQRHIKAVVSVQSAVQSNTMMVHTGSSDTDFFPHFPILYRPRWGSWGHRAL